MCFDLDRQIDRYLTFYTQKKLKSDQDPQAYQGLVMGPSTPPKKYCMIYIKFLFILSGLTLISRVWHRRFHQIIFLVCFEHDHTAVGFLTCMAEICGKKRGFQIFYIFHSLLKPLYLLSLRSSSSIGEYVFLVLFHLNS